MKFDSKDALDSSDESSEEDESVDQRYDGVSI